MAQQRLEINMERFGAWLKRHREAMRLTQTEFAERAKLRQPYVCSLETVNPTVNIGMNRLRRIEAVVGEQYHDEN